MSSAFQGNQVNYFLKLKTQTSSAFLIKVSISNKVDIMYLDSALQKHWQETRLMKIPLDVYQKLSLLSR